MLRASTRYPDQRGRDGLRFAGVRLRRALPYKVRGPVTLRCGAGPSLCHPALWAILLPYRTVLFLGLSISAYLADDETQNWIAGEVATG